MAVMLRGWALMTGMLRDEGFTELIYKTIPYIYHRYPSDEEQYLIFRAGGRLIESNLSAAVDLTAPVAFDSNASRGAAYATRNGVTVAESSDFNGFWEILSQLLHDRYDTLPVHTGRRDSDARLPFSRQHQALHRHMRRRDSGRARSYS